MTVRSGSSDWHTKKCVPCEGGVKPYEAAKAREIALSFPSWSLTVDGKILRAEYKMKNFQAALDFISRIGRLAEEEDHHPDIHLTNYRKLVIELSTHAAGGLTDNDFILAARIDRLPKELKEKAT